MYKFSLSLRQKFSIFPAACHFHFMMTGNKNCISLVWVSTLQFNSLKTPSLQHRSDENVRKIKENGSWRKTHILMFEIGQQIRQSTFISGFVAARLTKWQIPFSVQICTLQISAHCELILIYSAKKRNMFSILSNVIMINLNFKKSFTSMTNIFFAQSMTSTKRRKPKPINIPKVP